MDAFYCMILTVSCNIIINYFYIPTLPRYDMVQWNKMKCFLTKTITPKYYDFGRKKRKFANIVPDDV